MKNERSLKRIGKDKYIFKVNIEKVMSAKEVVDLHNSIMASKQITMKNLEQSQKGIKKYQHDLDAIKKDLKDIESSYKKAVAEIKASEEYKKEVEKAKAK